MTLQLSGEFSLQAVPAKAHSTIQQGSIFDLRSCRFKPPESEIPSLKEKLHPKFFDKVTSEGFSFEELYPYTEFDPGIDELAMVVTQTCDLVNGPETIANLKEGKVVEKQVQRFPKVPFINIALLEPLERLVLGTMERHNELIENIISIDLGDGKGGHIVCIDRIYSRDVVKEVLGLFNNDHKHIFFIAFGDAAAFPVLMGADLSKLFPLRVDHYEAISAQIKFQLKEEFANSVGWRIAELYGRVGLGVYEPKRLIDLEKVFQAKLLEVFKNARAATAKKFDELRSAYSGGDLRRVQQMLSGDLSK